MRPLPKNPSASLVGTLIGERYRLARAIGAGGMGAVFEALDEKLGRRVALKLIFLPSDENATKVLERFDAEARLVGPVTSDHIVKPLDYGIDAATTQPFIVMELLHGQTLEERAQAGLSVSEALTVLHQVGLALDRLHLHGIVHRDLKPENVFLTYRDDQSLCVKLVDFGIARSLGDGEATKTNTLLFSAFYVAPEQLRGLITRAVDIYALGLVAYFTLVGHHFRSREEVRLEALIQAACAPEPLEAASTRASRVGAMASALGLRPRTELRTGSSG